METVILNILADITMTVFHKVALLSAAALMAGGPSLPGASPSLPDYPRLGPPWPARKQPSWINQGLVFVGNWEPLRWAYRKNWQNWGNGRAGALAEQIHREEHSEATVIGLKKLGVNMVLTSFHKGFGIENEKEDMEEARQYGRLLHKHGLKLGVYVSALLLYEELYAEFPESRHWHRVLADGSPDTYGDDGYRYRAFLNHPEYLNYMKRVCELALEAGADLIHFDTVSQTPFNYHPMAEPMFREWLKTRFPTAGGWFFRSGLRHWEHVRIPRYSGAALEGPFDQPIMQEYLQFKAQLLSGYAAEMATFIQKRNPECAVEFNPHGILGGNRVLASSVDHQTLLPWLDAYWSEEPNHAAFTADGRLISKIRSFKVGQAHNSLLFSYTVPLPRPGGRSDEERDPRLLLAEAMAFNRQCLGDLGTPLAYQDFPESGRKYIREFRRRFDLFARGETAADVAVLRTFASMAYNNYHTHRETMLAEQALIQSQVAFDILEDNDLARVASYKTVVLANQECLSDEQIQTLRAYVAGGGGILATAGTGEFNQWRRQRDQSTLEALLGLKSDAAARGKPARHTHVKGRVAYLPGLVPSIAVPPRTAFVNRYWAPPRNAGEFVDALRWSVGGRLGWELTAPPSVAVNAYRQPARNRSLLHLVNFDHARRPALENLKLAIRTAEAASIRQVSLYSPDEDAEAGLPISRAGGAVEVVIPRLGVYAVVIVQN